MSLTALEQNLLNLADSLVQVGGQLVAENNPSYASLVPLATGTIDQINSALNPGAPPASALISQAASDIASGVVPVVSAVQTVSSKTATAPAKAAAVGTLLGEIETMGGDIISFFHKSAPSAPSPVATPALTVAPAAS